jgi:hypothetical protein
VSGDNQPPDNSRYSKIRYACYYRRAVTIVDAEQLGGVMLEELAELFDEERTSQTRVINRHRRAA